MLRRENIIVVTNELECERLCNKEALKAYKEQQHVKRKFRFLKDPLCSLPMVGYTWRTKTDSCDDDEKVMALYTPLI